MQDKTNHMPINRFRWITILEVTIAIILFGTWILVILSMITRNVSWVNEIKQRDTAVSLAKEGMELMYNVRDSNIDKWLARSCAVYLSGAPNNCSDYFYQWSSGYSLYSIHLSIDGRYTMSPLSDTGTSWLYLHTWLIEQQDWTSILTGFWYTHESTWGRLSNFRRYLVFTPMGLYPTETGEILYVASYVEYQLWNRTKSVVLESLVGSSR
jgi:hypothetical protein